jgi:clan AA aspartic protease (TIGR02281 family)
MSSAIPRLAACLTLVLLLIASLQARSDEIPLVLNRGGVYTVPVVVNGSIQVPFVVDSGAASVVIPEDVFRTLVRGGTVSQSDVIGTTNMIFGDGSTRRSIRLRLREVRIGNHRAENVVATVTPQNADPLLGQAFLSRFGAVSFDYQRRMLVISEGAPSLPHSTASLPAIAPSAAFGAGRFGAFAHDDVSGKYGIAWNEISQPAAEYNAVRGCNSPGCRVVFRVGPRQCGALATTDDGKVWGGSIRPTKAAAELAALQGCQKRTMAQCRLRGAECNG